jgi:hypothetical protein
MTAARILSPPSGATLRGPIEVVTWSYENPAIEAATIDVGTRRDRSDLASIDVGPVDGQVIEAVSIGDLPVDGSDVYVRLRYRPFGASWLTNEVRYVAATGGATPAIVTPSDGARLAGSTQVFIWDYAELPVDDGWLYLGSAPGTSDYGAIRVGSTTTVEVGDLPTDATIDPDATIHARLLFLVAGVWHLVDSTYRPGPSTTPTTDELTRELQALVGATPDGIVGPLTIAALNSNWLGRDERFDLSFAQRLVNDEAVVRWVQRRLNTRAGFGLGLDGRFGPATDTAVTQHLGRGGVVAAESFIELLQS